MSKLDISSMDKVKRERSANFSLQERDILVSLVQKYQNVLENKQSDASTWKKKEAAWECIQNEFNAQSKDTFRSVKTLKIKYEGLKRAVRKKLAAIRTELFRTGRNTATPLDDAEEQIKAMISTDGLESSYDSDVSPQDQETQNSTDMHIMEEFMMQIPPAVIIKTERDPFTEETNATTNEFLQLVSDESESLPSVSSQKLVQEKIKQPKTVNDKDSHDSPNEVIITPKSLNKKWDVTSRRNLKLRKYPALIANIPKKTRFNELTEAKLELVKLQKELLEAEIIEKKMAREYEENERQKESKRREDEHKWKEYEHKLRVEKLKRELEHLKREL